ncbi:aminopeptidase [Pseudoxanthomonas broegbernensis]|uniref:Aminopeptidase n=1 Tax=Pseudoxanthomonas broegbernensis TaxID=83619 RepID=A0A7V8K5W4_9GAMM|nr:serine hydrolase domain-containing protein [Pseudoxanthomonas broegbernensis]KAF1684939.1 aminopeptidase [Pseudoxanthomonas broegbernensis]MBB6066310.1 CubicO group peptidase (beta-lactamase class C family) [Pseudoxanthomonas broegbernensis]
MSVRILLLSALAFGGTALAAEPPPGDPLAALVKDPLHSVAPGCVIGVFDDGRPQAIAASGFADIAARRRLDADTVFYAASISKQFTVLAVAQLAQAGALSLDDEVRLHLPELPAWADGITVSMLFHHTSGVRDWITLMRMAGMDPAAPGAKQEALRLLALQQRTDFAPGTALAYSNGGYLLLAEIVERVSGKPFAGYAAERILAPLGMRDSYFLDGADPAGDNLAHGYAPVGDGFEIRDGYPRFGGSGGLMLSMNDLARYEYDIAHGHRVWTPAIRRIMLQPGALADGSPALYGADAMPYAGGLAVGPRKGRGFVQHTGSAEGFRHVYARLPDDGLSVAVLCNRADWVTQDKLDAVIEHLRPGLLTVPDARAVSGIYRSPELPARYVLQAEGDDLRLEIVADRSPAAGTRQLLRRAAEGGFGNASLTLLADPDGRGITVRAGRTSAIHFERVAE